MALANHSSGYLMLTPGGMIILSYYQAGDLRIPLGYNFIAPISKTDTLSTGFNRELHANHFSIQQLQFMPRNYNPFAQHTAFAPSAFIHQDWTYSPMVNSEKSSMDQMIVPATQPMNVTMPGDGFSDHKGVIWREVSTKHNIFRNS
jgi:hypothetical protein